MGNKRLIWFCLIVLMGSISAYSEVRLKPIFQGNIFGNISDAEEAKPSFRGNAEIRFVPVVEVGDKTAFLPILRASYVGNQTPIKIADEGTLLQQTQEYHGELVALRDLSEKTTLSLRGGRTEILLRETVDEDWGHGLYDHNLTFGGMGLEHRVSPEFLPTRLRLDAEYSWIRYPNYLSLGSQSGIDNIGAKELDTNSWQVFFKGETSLGIRHFITYGVGLSQDDYVDQRVIAAVGTISQKKRQDSLLDVLDRKSVV